MDNITLEDINTVLDKRYVNLIKSPVLSKSELLELIKEIDFDALNNVLSKESGRAEEVKEYSELCNDYLEVSPERTKPQFQKTFTREECIELIRAFFTQFYPELLEEFESRLSQSDLSENAPNVFKDDIVHTRMKDEGNTIESVFGLMHEMTHAFRYHKGEAVNGVQWKMAELVSLMNEFYFMSFLSSLDDPSLGADATSYMLYKLSDTKYMGLRVILEGDLMSLYEKNGKIDYETLKEYIETLDLSTKKGIMFLEFGKDLIKSIIHQGQLSYVTQGNYIIGELLGSNLFLQEGYYKNIPKLCEIMGKAVKDSNVSEEDLKELESLGINIMGSGGKIHSTDEDKKKYKESCSLLVQQIQRLELQKKQSMDKEDTTNLVR